MESIDVHNVEFRLCTVACFGRELKIVGNVSDGQYAPSDETIRRAKEVGKFYWAFQAIGGRVLQIACTGGYPGAATGMAKPPAGTNEGSMQKQIITTEWGVPDEKVIAEGESVDTFENFKNTIEMGALVPGSYSPDNPLVLSMSEPHLWRGAELATKSLLLPPGSLYALSLASPEDGDKDVKAKERDLAKVTIEAMRVVGESDVPPGTTAYVAAVSQRFHDLWVPEDIRHETITAFDANNPSWEPLAVPQLIY